MNREHHIFLDLLTNNITRPNSSDVSVIRSKISAGTLLGGVELFDCSLKKQIFKNRFEITHVGLSQAIIKDLSDGRRMVLKSQYGYEIDDIKILGMQ